MLKSEKLKGEQFAEGLADGFGCRTVGGPEFRMVGDRRVAGVEALRRRV
jgi:hypothetical protein